MQPYDPNKPLDDDTRQRLLERNRWQEVEENDRLFADEGIDSEPPDEDPDQSDSEDPEEDSEEDPEDPNDLLKPELRAELDRRGIEYSRRALKSELVALLRQSEESGSAGTE